MKIIAKLEWICPDVVFCFCGSEKNCVQKSHSKQVLNNSPHTHSWHDSQSMRKSTAMEMSHAPFPCHFSKESYLNASMGTGRNEITQWATERKAEWMVSFGANAASAGDEEKLSRIGTEILLENGQAGQYQCAGDCWLIEQFRDWACHVQGVPGVFKESLWKESCSYIPGYDIIRGSWWAILSGQLDRTREKAKGLVHGCRKIKFSGLGQWQGSSRL